jgi:hypothetical protein
MTTLAALGKLADCRAFPGNDVSAAAIKGLVISADYERAFWEELIEPLKFKGRDDLVQAIEKIIFTYRVKQTLKGMDKRLLGGRLLAHKKAAFTNSKAPVPSAVGEHKAKGRVNRSPETAGTWCNTQNQG